MEIQSDSMMPMSIDDLTQGSIIPLDLYVRLSDRKFVLLAKAGQKVQVDQLVNYQQKAVSYLWAEKKEYYKVVEQSITMAGLAIHRADLDDKQKTRFITRAIGTLFRKVENLGIDLDSYSNARQVAEAVISLSSNHRNISSVMESLSAHSDFLLAHSLGVSLFSTLIGAELGFEKKVTLEKLSLGGLLHDIGLKAIPQDLVNKPISVMTPEEHLLWETHAFKGMQMLQSLGIVPDDIVSILIEHHENSIGQGFPKRLRDVKMHPLAKVVALANQYIELILPHPNVLKPKAPREALIYISVTMGLPFNREAFRALERVATRTQRKAA